MKRSLLAIVVALSLSCGTEPSGTLTLTVEALPQFILTATVDVRGTVSRDPASDTPVIVTIAGASETVSDTVDGQFSLTVQLKRNQENQLSVMAFDGTGSIADAVVVPVFHDDTGPLIVSSTPFNKQSGVALTTGIELRYGEPLVMTSPNASFTLKQNSRQVPGTPTLSADQTLFTFQPDQLLEPASIYEMVVTGFTDEAGNPAGGGGNACFITTVSGLQTAVTTDTSNIFFSGGEPEVLDTVNVLGATLARSGATLYGLFEFQEERSLLDRVTRASVFVDLDLDNNPTTGFQAFKDFQFDLNFPELNTGLGAEAFISLDAHIIADSGFVGVNTDDVVWDVIDSFLPGVCGKFFGFHTTAIFGDSIQDDGIFAYAYTGFALEDTAASETSPVYADPVPMSGSFLADLTTPGPPTLRASPPPPNPIWPPQEREAPLIRLLRRLLGR